MKMQKCKGPCKKELELNQDNFYKRNDCNSGYMGVCKSCIYKRKYHKRKVKRKKEEVSNQYEDFIFC